MQLYDKQLKAVGVSPVNASSIFPEYYLIDVGRFEDVINEEIDEWIYFFKNGEIREDFTSPGILLASQRLDLLSMDKKERINYEKYLAYLASERDILTTAKEEGIEQGMQQGIEKGKTQVAKSMLDNGMLATDVAKFTGMSLEEVKKLE